MLIIGLDVSTSITGICLVDSQIEPGDIFPNINYRKLDHVDLRKAKTLWEKADMVHEKIVELRDNLNNTEGRKIDVLALEEPLLGFSKGMSSAATITTLMRFNGVISYIGREMLGIDPTYISAAHARKLCGIKLQKTAIAGMSQKEQVFKHMSEHDLKNVLWPKKKNGMPVDAAKDMCDAYVIARAACLVNK